MIPSPVLGTMNSNLKDCCQTSNQQSYEVSVNEFCSVDSKHINYSPYEAFNNLPLRYVDVDGNAPESAEQILTRQFGDERRLEYRLLDDLFKSRRFGLFNRNFVLKSLKFNEIVEKWLTSEIQNQLLVRLPHDVVHMSRGIQQEVQRQYRNGYLQLRRSGANLQEIVINRETSMLTLQEHASENLLWRDNMAAEVFQRESEIWRQLAHQSAIGEDFYVMNGPNLNLTTDEIEHLYTSGNYQYRTLLRMHINSRTFIENGEGIGPSPHEFIYRQFRQQRVTINGIDNRTRIVPFRSVFRDF